MSAKEVNSKISDCKERALKRSQEMREDAHKRFTEDDRVAMAISTALLALEYLDEKEAQSAVLSLALAYIPHVLKDEDGE